MNKSINLNYNYLFNNNKNLILLNKNIYITIFNFKKSDFIV